jgi:hypothetical protein
MINANEKRYETFNSIRRTIDAALFLGIPEDTISDVFKRRGMKKLFNKIMDNEWYSMGVTKPVEEGFEYTAEKYGIPNTLDDYTKDTIKDLQEIMNDMPLNMPWRIKPKDWLRSDKPQVLPEGFEPTSKAPPLPQTPMPDQKLVASMPQINQQTGLTRTQSALLSPSEQVIARRT